MSNTASAPAALQDGHRTPSGASAQPHPETAVLQSQEGPGVTTRAERMRQAKAELRSVSERAYVQAIDRWLDGGPWEGERWFFTSGRGMIVRLTEDGDALTLDDVTIVFRNPIRLHDLPAGTRIGRRLEARALAAVAVRGDAGWYDGKPTKVREGVWLVWDGRQYVHGPLSQTTKKRPSY